MHYARCPNVGVECYRYEQQGCLWGSQHRHRRQKYCNQRDYKKCSATIKGGVYIVWLNPEDKDMAQYEYRFNKAA